MYNQVPVVLMYYGGSWGLFTTKNFTGWPTAADPYTLPTNYTNAMLVVLTHLSRVSRVTELLEYRGRRTSCAIYSAR